MSLAWRPWHALVEIDAAQTLRFSQRTVGAVDALNGSAVVRYQGGIRIDSLPGLGVGGSCQITIPTAMMDAQSLRAAGVTPGDAACRVYLWQEGSDLSTRIQILSGRSTPGSERRSQGATSFEIAATEELADTRFPPYLMTRAGFPLLDVGSVGRPFPVLYGSCKGHSLIPTRTTPTDSSALRFVVAGHRIAQRTLTIKKDNATGSTASATVYTAADSGSGATYSYVELPQADWLDTSAFIADVQGKPGIGGSPISGLGDVIVDIIQSYAGLRPDQIDFDRLSRFRARANRITVASAFGDIVNGGIVSTLQARYGQALPVEISWRAGRAGADWLDFDAAQPSVRRLVLGRDLIGRIDPVEITPREPVYTEFTVKYDHSRFGEKFEGTLTIGPGQDERCAAAASRARAAGIRSGTIRYQEVKLVDVNTDSAAAVVGASLVSRFGVPRTRVSYHAPMDLLATLPLREKFLLTDSVMGWTDEPFRAESVALDPRNLSIGVLTLLSFNASP